MQNKNFQEIYVSLSKEKFLLLNRNDLTEEAKLYYDEELKRRKELDLQEKKRLAQEKEYLVQEKERLIQEKKRLREKAQQKEFSRNERAKKSSNENINFGEKSFTRRIHELNIKIGIAFILCVTVLGSMMIAETYLPDFGLLSKGLNSAFSLLMLYAVFFCPITYYITKNLLEKEPRYIVVTKVNIINNRAVFYLIFFLVSASITIGVFLFCIDSPFIDQIPKNLQSYIGIIGVAAFYFAGSFLHSIFSGNEEVGTSTTIYSCSHCGQHLNNFQRPFWRNLAYRCPYCNGIIVPKTE